MKRLVVASFIFVSFSAYCCGTQTTASSSPNACSSVGNGTYNCNSSRGISTTFGENVSRGTQPRNPVIQEQVRTNTSPLVNPVNALGHVPPTYNDSGQVNGGGVSAGTFDFRSSNMTRNGILPAIQGRCPGVVRDNMVVYYDCTSSAMIGYAQEQQRSSNRIEPVMHSGSL